MKKYLNPEKSEWTGILRRPTQTFDDLEPLVSTVFDTVRQRGDQAIAEYTAQFDGVTLDTPIVSKEEFDVAVEAIPSELKEAIDMAYGNIERFHAAQKTERVEVTTQPGVVCWQEKRPIQKVGLYVPGGTAPLFSTVLMLAIPAKLAGCTERILCTPPDRSGKVHPAILYTAQLCHISRVFKIGGIQAVAAMAVGTETVPQVHKIFGPGNQYVTMAKQWATKFGVAIDMPAGPSELLVMADDNAYPDFVAADLLSQAEHGTDSQVILVSTSKKLLDSVEDELRKQLLVLPRKEIAQKAIENSRLIYLESDIEALDLINAYGPEHLILCTGNNDFYIEGIQNAGSVFIGNYTPESAGDYASGTNHTLPTNGYAKQYSGVNLDSFTKSLTFQKITPQGIGNIGKAIEIMADTENLWAHKNAVTLRLKRLKKDSERVKKD